MAEETKCEVCNKLAAQKCGGCHNVFYCSKEHQKSGWKSHKKNCRPFKVCEDDIIGRHLVATRAIKPGEIILQEPPLIWGPSQVTVPVCLGCGKDIEEKTSRPCSKCGWPVCSEICEKAPGHLPECQYTVQRGDRVSIKTFGIVHPTYQCITVLRCLYQKQYLPEVWKKLERLQSHCEERKGSPKYQQERVTVAQFILRFFKLENVFTEEEIMRVCGIVMVNGHEIPLTEPAYVAIYESTSMFEHSCKANCNKSFTNDGEILITTGEKVEKGEHLSICYTDPLWGTPNRRHHLHETKFFWCNCVRCSDVTEFGTNFNSMKCQESNCTGNVLPKSFIEDYNPEQQSIWSCAKCKKGYTSYYIHEILERIGKDLSEMEKGQSESCKEFIKNFETYLHPNHFYMTDVKIALSQILGQEYEGGLPRLTEEDLHLKATLCQSVSNLIKTLVPGEKRIRGMLLFELHASVAEIGRRKSLVDPDELYGSLVESKKILQEAAELLKHEPDTMPEGKIYRQAKLNLTSIDHVLKTVSKTFGSPI